MSLQVGDLFAILRLKDDMTPAYQAAASAAQTASQNITRSVGQVSVELKDAQASVQALYKQYAEFATAPKLQAQIVPDIDAAIKKVDELKTELNSLKNPSPSPGGGGAGGGLFDSFLGDASAYAAGFLAFTAVVNGVQTAWHALTGEVGSSLTAWGEQEATTMRLVAALKAQSLAVPSVIDQYIRLSQQFQATTIYSDKSVQSTEALLSMVGGVMPAQMERATQATLDLATGLGINLESAARLVSKAAEGNTTTLQRYGIQIDASRVQTEGFTYVLDSLEEKFGGQAAAAAETFSGKLHQIHNDIENLQETIGQAIAQNPLMVQAMKALADATHDASTGQIDATHSLSNFVALVPGAGDVLAGLIRPMENAAADANALAAAIERVLKAGPPKGWKDLLSGQLPDVASNWREVESDMDKAKDVMHDVSVAQTQLTAGQKEAAEAALKHGLSVQETMTALREYWPDIDKSRISVEALKKAQDAAAAAAKKQAEEEKKAADEAAKVYQQYLDERVKQIEGMNKAAGAAGAAIAKSFGGQSVLKDMSVQMQDMQMHGKDAAQALTYVGDSSEYAAQKMFDLKNLLPSVSKAFGDAFQSIPSMLQSALLGGGGLDGFIKAFGSKLGEGLGSSIQDKLTSYFSDNGTKTLGSVASGILSALPVVGSLLGPAASAIGSLFGKMFGVSAAEQAGRQVEAQFEAQYGSFEKMMAAVGAAYAATGHSAAEAQADVTALMNAEKNGADAANAALAKINGVMNQQQQDATDLDAAIQKYGFTIDQLGPTLQKQRLDEQAQQLIRDWTLLVGSGIDMTVVNDKMASTMNDYLQMALKTGQEIPEAMKPILEKMAAQGDLTDANGNKLDVAAVDGLAYSKTMTEGFQSVVDKLQQLIDKIGGVSSSINSIPKTVDVSIDAHWNVPDMPRIEAPQNHLGTIVRRYHAGVSALAGLANDEVPAVLQTGESVLNRRATAALGDEAIRALNAGTSRLSPSHAGAVVVDMGPLATEVKALRAEVSGMRADMQMRIPQMNAQAVKDAFNVNARRAR